MKREKPFATGCRAAALILALGLGRAPYIDAQAARPNKAHKGTAMTQHATGVFDVKVTPLALGGPTEDSTLGRLSIEKKYHGDLDATGDGQMLTAATEAKGSGAYVAIERVNGTLRGHSGTFALQHRGIMRNGEPSLDITVVPDSGTGQLVGLTGTLGIVIADGKHSYDFAYELPESP
jgi:hypothetical protein